MTGLKKRAIAELTQQFTADGFTDIHWEEDPGLLIMTDPETGKLHAIDVVVIPHAEQRKHSKSR